MAAGVGVSISGTESVAVSLYVCIGVPGMTVGECVCMCLHSMCICIHVCVYLSLLSE